MDDLKGGKPFVINESSIQPVDVKPEYTHIYKLLHFYKEDKKHTLMIFFLK